jgi:hypothetical protein
MRSLHRSSEVVPMESIISGEALVKICGHWLIFHDATVLRLILDRDGVLGLDNSRSYTSSCPRFSPRLPITQGRTQG